MELKEQGDESKSFLNDLNDGKIEDCLHFSSVKNPLFRPFKQIAQKLEQFRTNFDSVTTGNYTAKLQTPGSDDQLVKSFNKMTANLEGMSEVVRNVAEGNLNTQMDTQNGNNKLAESFNRMMLNQIKTISDNQERIRYISVQAGINEKLRGNLTVQEIAKCVMTFLCKTSNSQIGAFYIKLNSKR